MDEENGAPLPTPGKSPLLHRGPGLGVVVASRPAQGRDVVHDDELGVPEHVVVAALGVDVREIGQPIRVEVACDDAGLSGKGGSTPYRAEIRLSRSCKVRAGISPSMTSTGCGSGACQRKKLDAVATAYPTSSATCVLPTPRGANSRSERGLP